MEEAYRILASGLEANGTLLDFTFDSCDEDTPDVIFKTVALGAVKSSSLRRVDFDNYQGDCSLDSIVEVLSNLHRSPSLLEFKLPDCTEWASITQPSLRHRDMMTRQQSIKDVPCVFDLAKFIADPGPELDPLSFIWNLPCLTIVRLNLSQEVSVYQLCLALQHNPMLREIEIYNYEPDKEASEQVAQAVRRHCPGLQSLVFDHDEPPDSVQQALKEDRSAVVYQWMTDVPTPPRAACVLRMLCHMDQNPSLDRARAMDYCGRGFRYAVESGNAMQVVMVGQAMLELMERKDAPRGLIRGCTDVHLQASVVARGRYGLRSSDPGGEWTGAARRCQSMVELSCGWRRDGLLGWRRAVEAKRDAGRVFASARDGRPLELGKRLVLGRLAGALESLHDLEHGGSVVQVTAVEAALLGGHMECVKVLREASG